MMALAPMCWLLTELIFAAQTQVLRVGRTPETQALAPRQKEVQTLSVERMGGLIRSELAAQLPLGLKVLRIVPEAPITLPFGPIEVSLLFKEPLRPGLQGLTASFDVNQTRRQVPVRLALGQSSRAKTAAVIERGAEVLVVVRSGNVTVQSLATSQEAGAVGEKVRVLPNNSQRMVHGTVIDGRTVEIGL